MLPNSHILQISMVERQAMSCNSCPLQIGFSKTEIETAALWLQVEILGACEGDQWSILWNSGCVYGRVQVLLNLQMC